MKTNPKLKIIIIVTLAVTLAMYIANELFGGNGIGLDFFINGSGTVTTFLPTGLNVEFDQKSGASFYCPGSKDFFFATKDGIQYINEDGKTLMSESYTMQNPRLYGEGQTAAVVEQSGGYEIYVFDSQGLMYSKQFQNPIVNFAINSSGYSSAITKKGDEYESFAFNQKGELMKRSLDSNSIVISTDISGDGRIWSLCYLDINGSGYNSRITFTYLNSGDSFFASLEGANVASLNNQIFCIIRFMDGNNLIVVSERSIFCVNPSSASKPVWTAELNNELEKIDFSDNRIAVATGRGLLNKSAEPVGRVVLFDLTGKRVWEHDTGEKITALSCSEEGVIISRGRNFSALSLKGLPLWEYTGDFDSKAMLFMETSSRVILQTSTNAAVMKLTKINLPAGKATEPPQTGD